MKHMAWFLCQVEVLIPLKVKLFICNKDVPYIEEDSKKFLNQPEKPTDLMSKLVEGYTSVDDWILDANGGIGELQLTIYL